MITIIISGSKEDIDPSLTLAEVLKKFHYSTELPFAVAVNQHLIHRINYEITYLTDGDQIDIIYPMQGG